MKQSQVFLVEVILAAAALAACAFFALRWGIEGVVHNRKIEVVPDLKGKSLSGAMSMLSPLNLPLLKEGEEFNGSVPIGSILRQRPAAGTKVREGKTIRVVVSQGGETVFAPSIISLPLRNAEILLRQSQLALGEVTESYSLRLEKGLVLSQDPRAESSVEKNTLVNVVVSAGPPPDGILLMPEFLRKNVAEASQWAERSGVRPAIEKDPGSLFPGGTILEQQPQPDAVVDRSTKVVLKVSARAAVSEASKASFAYQVPQGSSESLVRILLADERGEREIFNGLRHPGSRVEIPLPATGRSRAKIFLNGILVEERDY
jgi:serine/threonine-protein kinase